MQLYTVAIPRKQSLFQCCLNVVAALVMMANRGTHPVSHGLKSNDQLGAVLKFKQWLLQTLF